MNAGPMLGRHRRRWANIGPTLGIVCVVFAGLNQSNVRLMLASVVDVWPAINQHWFNVSWPHLGLHRYCYNIVEF